MKTLTVFDSAMCCSTGVCDSDVDQVPVDFSADVQWLKGRGVLVERYNLAQQPMSFVQNEKAKVFLEASKAEGLPLSVLASRNLSIDGRCSRGICRSLSQRVLNLSVTLTLAGLLIKSHN